MGKGEVRERMGQKGGTREGRAEKKSREENERGRGERGDRTDRLCPPTSEV